MDLISEQFRRKILTEIKSDENIQRKVVSYKKHNMQNDNFHQYVVEFLESKYDPETVKEMTVFSNINLQKRISKSEASIYKHGVDRDVFIGNEESEEFVKVFDDMNLTQKMRKVNECYKYQDQCALQIIPKDGKLCPRVLLPHHYDVIPDPVNPENAVAYIISNFDNTDRDKIRREDDKTGFSQGDKYRDGVNQKIGDWDDPQLKEERYYFWSKDFNYVMNGKGEILDKETESEVLTEVAESDPNIMSPLFEYQIMPFVDISTAKDFEYWVRSGDALYYATIIYNVIFSNEFKVVELQGQAQAYYKGDAEHMPENLRVGPDKLIFIPVNPNNPVDSEFGFANPGSDLNGIKDFRESWLSSFLSSRGLDVSIINGNSTAKTASSGVERMLQMIEKFEASLDDFALFKHIEQKAFKIIYHWIQSLAGDRVNGELVLDEAYQMQLPDISSVNFQVEFQKPEMIKTDMEVLDVLSKEIEMGISSKVHALMEYRGMSFEEAQKRVQEIDQLELGVQGSNEQEGADRV